MPEQTSSLEHALGRLADSMNRQTTAIEAVHARIGTMQWEIVSALHGLQDAIGTVCQESVNESEAVGQLLDSIESSLKDISIALDMRAMAA